MSSKNLIPSPINRLIGQAMHTYQMLSDGDAVLVAVSGGIDSLVLAAVLKEWQKKAPLRYTLTAVHLELGFAAEEEGRHAASALKRQLANFGLATDIEFTAFGPESAAAENGKGGGCFHCARRRRNRLFALAREKHCNKLAFGHHKEDIIETFFLNLLYSGNLSTMLPCQPLFDGNLTVIRPLAFLGKQQIRVLAERFQLHPAAIPCPLAGSSKRQKVREMLHDLYRHDLRIEGNIFAALANVRSDYLLRQPLLPESAAEKTTDNQNLRISEG